MRFLRGRPDAASGCPQLLQDLSQRPGCFGKRELHLLRVRRPNHLHGQRIWRDQFCGADVGRLPGSGQSTGDCRTAIPTLGFINPTFIRLARARAMTRISTTSPAAATAFRQPRGYDLATGWGSPNGAGLIDALAGTPSTPSFTISATPSFGLRQKGRQTGHRTITTAVSGGFNSAIRLVRGWSADRRDRDLQSHFHCRAGRGRLNHDHGRGLDHRDRNLYDHRDRHGRKHHADHHDQSDGNFVGEC